MKRLGITIIAALLLTGLIGLSTVEAKAATPAVSVSVSCKFHTNGKYQMGVRHRVCKSGSAFALIRFNTAIAPTSYRACLDSYQPKAGGHGKSLIQHLCTTHPQFAEPGVIYANRITTGGPGPTTYKLTFTASKTKKTLGVVRVTKP